jgi:hypothetical protein
MVTAKEEIATKSLGSVAVLEKPAPKEFTDESLVTVLFGFGKVAPTAKSLLDEYVVEGGVIRNVPYSIAKHWKNGTRPDGKKPHGRVGVTILSQDATEDDFLAAAGISRDDLHRLATVFSINDIQGILAELGPDKARALRDALNQQLGGR